MQAVEIAVAAVVRRVHRYRVRSRRVEFLHVYYHESSYLMSRPAHLWLAALLTLGAACGGKSEAEGPDAGGADAIVADADAPDAFVPVDPSEELFRPDHILEIDITLAAADWAVLREQSSIGEPRITCGQQPLERPYTYFPGEITIDGQTISDVGVRKKGGFGSLSSTRPSMKIKANEYVSGQKIFGLKRLTLNNNKQDEAEISQCLGYELFSAAGVPASRCSFAHVTVNGEDLGLYSNVESLRPEFLGRHFENTDGRLYESGGDFVPGGTAGFQPKVDRENPDCSDIDALIEATQVPDAELVASLGAYLDLDEFMTYWAMEVLTDHWDGYANNRNNYFFYHDPISDRFQFIPWGIDALFTGRQRTTRPYSVFACGGMAWRLYDVEETRDMYLDRLRQLLDTVWDEAAILAEIARMQALIEPLVDPTHSGDLAGRIQGVRDFVLGRRQQLTAELDAGPPVWPYPEGEESCRISLGTISATFDTTWDSLDEWIPNSGTTSGTVGGVSVDSDTVYSNAGLSDDSKAVIQVFAQLDDGRFAVLFLLIQDPANLTPGTRAIDLVNVAAMMSFYDPATDTSSGGGLILNGSLTLTSAEATSGAPLVGSMTGEVFEL